MSFIQDLKCKRGSHKWSEWEFIVPGDPRSKHCGQKRVCENCQASETRSIQLHAWQEWEYFEDGLCDQVRYCKNCRAKETGKVKHNWGGWAYTAADVCEQKRTCQVCDEVEFREVEHEWSEWSATDDPTRQTRQCKRCKAEEEREKPSYQASCSVYIIEPREQDSFVPMDIKLDPLPEGLKVSFIEDPSKIDRFTFSAIVGMYHWLNNNNNTQPVVMPYQDIEEIRADFYGKKGNVTQYIESAKGELKTVPAGRELRLRMIYRNQARGTKLKLNLNLKDRFGLNSDKQAISFYNEVLAKLA